MTLQQLIEKTREIWLAGQTAQIRDVFAMTQGPTESMFDFVARKTAVAQLCPSPVDGWILMQGNDEEPLWMLFFRHQGSGVVTDYFGREGTAPVPTFPTGGITQGNAQLIVEAFKFTYPPQAEFLPTARPFGQWPFNRNPLQYEPLPSDAAPINSAWPPNGPDPGLGFQFKKVLLYGRNTSGIGIPIWERIP